MRKLIAISALLMLFSGGGCAPTNVVETWQIYDPVNIVQRYNQRVDKVTLSAGNAKEVNTRIHEVDPWPRYVANTRIPANGERMARAVERYRKARSATLANRIDQLCGNCAAEASQPAHPAQAAGVLWDNRALG